MNTAVRALGIGMHFTSRIAGLPVPLDPTALPPPDVLEDPHAPECPAVGEEPHMIAAERARLSTARARGPAAGRRKEPA